MDISNRTFVTACHNLAAVALLVAVLALPALAGPAAPQVSGTYLEEEVVSAGEAPNLIKLWVAGDRMRFETPGQMALVWIGGADGRMMMIQHQQRMYLEWTAEQMKAMGQMMGGAMQESGAEEDEMSEPPTFTRTGNTKTVGEWSAYEVRVEHPEQTGDTTMWFSEDVAVDPAQLMQSVASSMESMQAPMLGGMGGGDASGFGMLASAREMMARMNMPAGFPVQIITTEGGDTTTITLKAVRQGPLEASVFEAPAGYQKMQMPGIR